MEDFLNKVFLTVLTLLIVPFMLVYLIGDWIVKGVKNTLFL
jgi:hypothetical protein